MITLARTVRCVINDAPLAPGLAAVAGLNGYAGVPPMRGLGRFYELLVRCRGDADPVTGYFLNIKVIDEAVRSTVLPLVGQACRDDPGADPAAVVRRCLAPLNAALGGSLHSLRLNLTPYYSLEMAVDRPTTALLRQRFEFAAAHRLHVASMSDADNRAYFGKCNNPSGHGHNYVLEPCVAVPVLADVAPGAAASPSTAGMTVADLESVVHRVILSRFDHTHLNVDTPEFRIAPLGDGVNPSVENIARVFFDLLAPAVTAAAPACELRQVTVWETEKTSATYPG